MTLSSNAKMFLAEALVSALDADVVSEGCRQELLKLVKGWSDIRLDNLSETANNDEIRDIVNNTAEVVEFLETELTFGAR